jgi:hypothetical protein
MLIMFAAYLQPHTIFLSPTAASIGYKMLFAPHLNVALRAICFISISMVLKGVN